MPPQKGMVFAPFRSGTGVPFAHFCLESGMVFEGYVFVSVPSEPERKSNMLTRNGF